VLLNWSDNSSNESGFQIERRYAAWIWDVIASVGPNSTSFVDSTAIANVLYEYRVAATSAAGMSPYSNGVLVNTGGASAASTFAQQAAVITPTRTGSDPLPTEPANSTTFSNRVIDLAMLA
jgi:hypothetical protein